MVKHGVLENISTAKHTFSPQIAVDEWLVTGDRSTIHEFGYRINDGQTVTAPVDQAKPLDGGVPRVCLEMSNIILVPKDRVQFWYDLEEIKRRSDVHVLKFRYSTNSPRVRVDAPAGFDWRVEFAHREDAKKERYSNVTVLPGLLLPHQCIFVWWWDKSKETAWRQSFTAP